MNEEIKATLETIFQKWSKNENRTDPDYIMYYGMYMGYIKALSDTKAITQEEFMQLHARMEHYQK